MLSTLHFLSFCWFFPFFPLIFPCIPPFACLFSPFRFLLCHPLVAQGRVWALRQVNPSSDNDRFGRGGGGGLEEEEEEEALRHSLSHQPRHLHLHQDSQEHPNQNLHQIHQSHDPAESCDRRSLPSQLQLVPENEHQAHIYNSDIPEEPISQIHSNQHLPQHGLASNPPHPDQNPPLHLESVFRGSDLVDWLVERGLCAGRPEAQLYGVRLQLGGVLDHLTGQHSFRDEPTLLYQFTQGRGEGWSRNIWEEMRR